MQIAPSHSSRARIGIALLVVAVLVAGLGIYLVESNAKTPPHGDIILAPVTLGNVTLLHAMSAEPGCPAGNYCYHLSFESIPVGAKAGNLTLRVEGPNLTVLTRNVSSSATVLTQSSGIVVSATIGAGSPFNVTTWESGTSSANLTLLMIVIINLGQSWDPQGAGLSLISGLSLPGQGDSTNALP